MSDDKSDDMSDDKSATLKLFSLKRIMIKLIWTSILQGIRLEFQSG
jgi:hypothetical protein